MGHEGSIFFAKVFNELLIDLAWQVGTEFDGFLRILSYLDG